MHRTPVKESSLVRIFRLLTGLVFIFSSSVKGVDPLGTAYRVEDYLLVYGLDWMKDMALALAIFLIVVEFLLGFALLFKLKPRLTATGTLLIMVFFTAVTWFDARYDLVTDCGCFGDAVKLTNWQTFYKNLVLILMAAVIFLKRKTLVPRMPGWLQSLILAMFTGLFVWFVFYNYNHLPLLDFRDWKVGREMKTGGDGEARTYVTYRNLATGEDQEFLSPNYPWNDSLWMTQWEFVDQRTDYGGAERKHNVFMEDEDGNDLTSAIIGHPGDQFLLVAYDLDYADGEGMLKAAGLFRKLDDAGIAFDALSASGSGTVTKYKEVYRMDYPVYFADDVELKAMIRSNPGLLWLRNGVVMKKWHHNDFPDWKELESLLKSDE